MPDDIKYITQSDQVFANCKRSVFVALNLMYLGNYKLLNHHSHILWIDGIMGKLFLKYSLTSRKLEKLPGSKFLAGIICSGKMTTVSVLGDCPPKFEEYLRSKGIILGRSLKLDNFQIKKIDLNSFDRLESFVIISLPSPKQELLANILIEHNKNIQKIFCVGGAVHMIADPSLECPEFFRRLNLEWLFRLKTDPLRRSKRLITQIIGFIINLKNLHGLKFTKFSCSRLDDV